MERHLRDHMPVSCPAEDFKDRSDNLLEHRHMPVLNEENETGAAALCTNGSHMPQMSSRLRKRKRISSPDSASLLPEDGNEGQSNRQKGKRVRKAVKRDRPVITAPSKEYLAEGSEHIYRTHTCPKCRRCFKMRSHLQEHLHLHFPDPSLQCPTCKRYFTSKSKLRIHRLRESGEKVHHCHLCDYSAVERNAIRRHLASVHAEGTDADVNTPSYPCPTCGQRFHQSRSLKTHMKMHSILSDSEPLTCFQQGCTFQSSLRKELLRHTAEVHGVKALECRHHACGALFQSEAEMEAHYRTHIAYHCSQCDFSCSNKTVFLQHQRHGHPGNDKLCCDFCSFSTFNPVELEQHLGHLHANEKIHQCSQCSYVTSHKRGLKRHMLMHSGEKPHKCGVCDFRCRDESYLSKHMLTHSNDKNFMCAECGYVTKWKHYLNVHMRKHAGDLRYQCDQCPYRSHRMDQLNSHKLRHQAKTLMCEICAYACKRKYELRNHMLAKHSGEDKQPSVYKCKYCTYTTCYRQALQNHENCKHTKLKEFRCALCCYSSFSSISLFLHKRKVHGYVPGDKTWLENYTAKEKERNSAEISQDFYNNPSTVREQFEQSAAEGSPPCSRKQSDPPDSEHRSACKETATGSQIVNPVDAFNVVSQEKVSEGVADSPPPVNSPEEYCTLVLTTLSASDYQISSLQNEEDHCSNRAPTSPNLKWNGSNISQERTNFSLSLSSAEEDDVDIAEAEYEQRDLDEPLSNTSQPGESALCPTQTPDQVNDGASCAIIPASERNQPLESELRLEAIRRHDKEQAEAMVLEGRVQMLVVPTKNAYGCDKCSYVTSKETAFKHHCQNTCPSRMKEHKCEACGAQFKQKRGLDSHIAKKCPTQKNSDQTRRLSSQNTICVDFRKDDQEVHRQSADVDASHLTNCKAFDADVLSPSESEHQQTEKLLKVQPSKGQLFSNSKRRDVPVPPLYTKKDGKFKCKLCSFFSFKLGTVERHVSTCRKRENPVKSQVNDDRGGKARQAEEHNDSAGNVSAKHRTISCPSCAFKCYQKRALASHEKRGCLKPSEVQCTMCSFVAKCKLSLTRHILYAHDKKKFGAARLKRLHCQHCTFTCKQERCMAQHIALKHKGARPHRCQYCPFSTTRRYRLEEHESLHTGVGRHGCDVCEKTFGTVTKLRQHKTRIHDKRPTHFCSLCDFSGYTLEDVRRHNLRCHCGELNHACAYCEAQFSSEVALRNHCKRVHQLQTCFSCKQCDYTCSSEVMLKMHQEKKHPQAKCSTCQVSLKTKESLAAHQRSHLVHQCQLCPFASKTRQLLAKHLLSEHEEGSAADKPLKCNTCQFVCRHQLVLEQHLRLHGGKRLYKCSDCEYSTRNKQKITWHIRIHTGEKPYSCEQCSYTCTDPSRLKLHMRVHQEEKKYICLKCGYKCKWATQLKYHMTKHTGDKPYACDECDYRTNRADALRAHRDTQHCDLRPYVCEKCGKAFKTTFILKTHQRQHSDDRPYTCGLCHKAFRWPAGLRNHYLSHTKQQPFSCCRCSYRAKQKFQVVKHLRRHHPEISVEQGVVRDSEAVSLTLKDALQGTLDGRSAEVVEEEEEEEEEGGTVADKEAEKSNET